MATTGITEAGGGLGAAATPEYWAAYVLQHLSQQSVVLASGATRVDTPYRLVHGPRTTADGAADWYVELDEIGADCPTGDDLELTPRKCAALCRLSNEAVNDSSPSILDMVGTSLTQSVALAVDKALLAGTGGKQPTGVVDQASATMPGPISIDALISAAGQIRNAGGNPTVAYVSAADVTVLQLSKDQQGRPLLGPDYTGGPSSTVYGLTLWPTPALAEGTALVADPTQIIVAVRQDAEIAVSQDAIFTSDGTIARVIARVDVGVNDARGLVQITGSAVPDNGGEAESTKASAPSSGKSSGKAASSRS